MSRFLIEVPHPAEQVACARVVKVFMATGSHFLARAEWGCCDGNHSAWLIVDADSKDSARAIVPPPYRPDAKIIGLNRFTMEEIDDILRHHTA